jgi:hypothetical protein
MVEAKAGNGARQCKPGHFLFNVKDEFVAASQLNYPQYTLGCADAVVPGKRTLKLRRIPKEFQNWVNPALGNIRC